MVFQKTTVLTVILAVTCAIGCKAHFPRTVRRISGAESQKIFAPTKNNDDLRQSAPGSRGFNCHVAASVVAVYVDNPLVPWKEWVGSGVVVGDGRHVLTACHVLEHGRDFSVARFFCSQDGPKPLLGEALPVQVIAWSSSSDVGIMEATGTEPLGDPLPFLDTAPEVNAPVWLFGSRSYAAVGVVEEVPFFEGMRVHVRGEAQPGDSGGAVVDAHGRLVGLAVGRGLHGGFYAFVPMGEITEALTETPNR